MDKLSNQKLSGILFIAAGAAFFAAAFIGDGNQVAFYGLGTAFIAIGAAFIGKSKKSS